jgi:predicted transcriptional regulator
MGSRFEEAVYQMLLREPVTPNEVAKELEISHKTALRALMHLALTKEDVYYKNSGRIHLFWKNTVLKAEINNE